MSKSNIIASGLEIIPLEIKKIFINRLKGQGIKNNLVLNVMQQVPRHLFVEPALKKRAYDDDALPIGFNQTISSPYIVAKMTELIIENDIAEDFNEDGHLDILLQGNLFDFLPQYERQDGIMGLCLIGNSKGQFKVENYGGNSKDNS